MLSASEYVAVHDAQAIPGNWLLSSRFQTANQLGNRLCRVLNQRLVDRCLNMLQFFVDRDNRHRDILACFLKRGIDGTLTAQCDLAEQVCTGREEQFFGVLLPSVFLKNLIETSGGKLILQDDSRQHTNGPLLNKPFQHTSN